MKCKFKAGDRVRVLRAFASTECPKVGWNWEMGRMVGNVYTIEEILPGEKDIVGLSEAKRRDGKIERLWWFPTRVLENYTNIGKQLFFDFMT